MTSELHLKASPKKQSQNPFTWCYNNSPVQWSEYEYDLMIKWPTDRGKDKNMIKQLDIILKKKRSSFCEV